MIEEIIEEKSDDISNISDEEYVITIDFLKQNMKDNLLTFVSKLYANPNFPRNLVQLIIDDFHQLLSDTMANLKPLLFNILKEIEFKNVKEVDKII